MARRFSWKRATGLTSAKRKLSGKTGIPLTKSGRQRKLKRVASGGGCCLMLLQLVAWLATGVTVIIVSVR